MVFKKGKIKVYFKSASIIRAICRQIRSADAVYACVAWVTHPKILDAMEETKTELIMTRKPVQSLEEANQGEVPRKGAWKKKVAHAS